MVSKSSVTHFRGLSTETKSTTPGTIAVSSNWFDIGSTWFETDTGKLFIYNGTSWVLINP